MNENISKCEEISLYGVYHDKSAREIVVRKNPGLLNGNYSGKVVFYNDNWWVTYDREAAIEKAKEIRDKWVEDLEIRIKGDQKTIDRLLRKRFTIAEKRKKR